MQCPRTAVEFTSWTTGGVSGTRIPSGARTGFMERTADSGAPATSSGVGWFAVSILPTIQSAGIGPQWRLSCDWPGLSPSMKNVPSGTVTGVGSSHSGDHSQCSSNRRSPRSVVPLHTTSPWRIEMTSPGPATMRLIHRLVEGPMRGSTHATPSEGELVSTSQGPWNRTTSPICGVDRRYASTSTGTRCPTCSSGASHRWGRARSCP